MMNISSGKTYRPAYIAAWALITLVLVIAVAGSWIMPHDFDHEKANALVNSLDPKVKGKVSPPFPPSWTNLLGTDLRGFDVLSLLLNGLKYTLGLGLLITFVRFAFALPIGFWSGATGKFRSALSSLQWITTALPPLLFVFPLLYSLFFALQINLAPSVTSVNFILFMSIFFVMVSFIGIFPVCQQVSERARFYHDHLFVTASLMMGGKLRHRIFKHLVPNMRGEIAFLFLTEFLQVMFLLGQLAVLGIFVGGATLAYSGDSNFYVTTSTGEWFGLIAYSVKTFRFEPWVIISVSCCFIGLVAIFQFFITQIKKGPNQSMRTE